MTSFQRLLAAASLALGLSACHLFGPGPAPLSEACYDAPASAHSGAAAHAAGAPGAAYVPGQLLVRYRAEAGLGLTKEGGSSSLRAAAQGVRRDYGLTRVKPLGAPQPGRAELVALPPGADLEATLNKLRADPRVRYAEPNRYLYPLAEPAPAAAPLPDDPLLGEQWHLLEFGLPEAWALQSGSAEVVVAVLDSGVDAGHEDLRGRTLPGCDLYSQDNDPSPGSPAQLGTSRRHGTHVAGIALATGDNGLGVAGVAHRGVRLLPVKVFDDSGAGSDRTTTSVVADAIRWAAGLSVEGLNRTPYPAKIINVSLGGKGTDAALNEAVADARRAGALVIAASGNEGSEEAIYTPANAPGALAVGSIDQDTTRSYFSNYSRAGRTVDLMAPGGTGQNACGSIYSTLSPSYQGARESEYGCERGTSMAAPFVAGVAALIWSQNPDLSADEVRARLLGATLLRSDMDRAEYGAGIICADRALGAATLCGRTP